MATSNAMKKVEEIKENHAAMLARARQKAAQAANAQKHTLIAVGAAFVIGEAEKRGMQLPTVTGVDPKLLYGVAALGAGFLLKDKTARQIGQSVGDGLLSIVAYNQGRGISALTPTSAT